MSEYMCYSLQKLEEFSLREKDKLLKSSEYNKEVILYHGTTPEAAEKIKENGFRLQDKINWEGVPGTRGQFIYASDTYAPYYALQAIRDRQSLEFGLVKLKIKIADLYPDEDFVMMLLGKPVYTQEDFNRIDMEKLRWLGEYSYKMLGNVAFKPESASVIGVKIINGEKLLSRFDPIPSVQNHLIMGRYYRSFCDYIYNGGKIEDFPSFEDFTSTLELFI